MFFLLLVSPIHFLQFASMETAIPEEEAGDREDVLA